MSTTTAAGSTIAICATLPSAETEAAYGALTFTEIGQVEKIGVMGAVYAKTEFQPLFGPKQKHKGAPDYGSLTPSLAHDESDPGQAILRAAADSPNLFAFRVIYPTGAKRFFQGRVFGYPETVDGADTLLMVSPTIEINSVIVKVAATGAVVLPTVSISGALSKSEGNSGTVAYTYVVTLSQAAPVGGTAVPWALAYGSTDASDFASGQATSGTLTIAQGQLSGTVTINVNGDTSLEGDETFTFLVSTPPGYIAGAATSATGTILNEDAPPAPVFTSLPSISPTSGTAGTTTFAATDGIATNATSISRRWLLGTTSIGTGTTVVAPSAGTLTLENTAAGPGGSKTVTSTAVTVAAAATPTPTDAYRVLLVGSSTPEYYATQFTGPENTSVFKTADGATIEPVGTTGAGITVLGDTLQRALNRPIQFVTRGAGGTTLAQWEASGSTQRSGAVAAVQALGGVDAIVSIVGFNDARTARSVTSQAAHETKLRSFFSKLRSELGAPNLPIFVGTSQKYNDGVSSSNQQIVWVRSAELNVADNDANCYLYAHAFDLAQLSDGIHQTEASYPKHAARGAAQMLSVIRGTASARGPKLTGAAAVSDTQTRLTLRHYGNATDFIPTTGISGFQVSADSFASTLAISAAIRENATHVLLTHASTGASSATGSVRYMQQGAMSNSAPIFSASAPNAPADFTVGDLAFQTIAASGSVPSGSTAKTAQVNFGRTDTNGVSGWTLFGAEADAAGSTAGRTSTTGVSHTLLDTSGASTGWTLTATEPSCGASTNSAASGVTYPYPTNVALPYWFNGDSAANTGNARITSTTHTISGLNPAKKYNLSFFGGRTTTTPRSTLYSSAGKSVTQPNANNSSISTLTDLSPDSNGVLTYSYAPVDNGQGGQQFGYINALVIAEQP